jgi:hypothetical protein
MKLLPQCPYPGGRTRPDSPPFRDTSVAALSTDKSQLLVGEGPMIQDHPLWLLPVIGGPSSWSPDGKRLVYASGGGLYLAKADGTEPHQLLPENPDPKVWAWCPRWSFDSSRVRFTLYQMEKYESAAWEVTVDERGQILSVPLLEQPGRDRTSWGP